MQVWLKQDEGYASRVDARPREYVRKFLETSAFQAIESHEGMVPNCVPPDCQLILHQPVERNIIVE